MLDPSQSPPSEEGEGDSGKSSTKHAPDLLEGPDINEEGKARLENVDNTYIILFFVSERASLSISLHTHNYILTGRSYGAENCTILSLLRCSFRWYPF